MPRGDVICPFAQNVQSGSGWFRCPLAKQQVQRSAGRARVVVRWLGLPFKRLIHRRAGALCQAEAACLKRFRVLARRYCARAVAGSRYLLKTDSVPRIVQRSLHIQRGRRRRGVNATSAVLPLLPDESPS